ncbi:MAG: acetate--CoA ligase family protein, partial [Chloroflexi bacterium]|nr:acetate--CoA ligase family protein [Chloroflexota bacterium]
MKRIKSLFNPASVAIIGGTDRKGTVGRTLLKNLLVSRGSRRIYPINPNREKAFNVKCYPSISALPEIPDLAIIAVHAARVADIVEDSGKTGVKSIIIISAGFKEIGTQGKNREDKIAGIAKMYDIRVLGPNCMGVIRPSSLLNTTFIERMPKPGYVAFLSQSGALGAGILDWAMSKNIGISAFVSLGSMLDVDFGDMIDFFGQDPETRSIIIYTESIGNARKFMSASRGFARNKPIIVLKPGKFHETIKVAKSHTGAMVGEDLHYDAVFRRAGVVSVEEIKDLFNCASILNTINLPKGPNLAIISNGGGPAVLATDILISRGGKLANLDRKSISILNKLLPHNWSRSNPLDILEDADVSRFNKAINVISNDNNVHGAVIIYTPQGSANPANLARMIIKQVAKLDKPVLTVFIGDSKVSQAKKLLYDNNVPVYDFPEEAIKTYLYMYQYASNLEILYETPEESSVDVCVAKSLLKPVIDRALKGKSLLLGEDDSRKLLRAYDIPFPQFDSDANNKSCIAVNAEDAVKLATAIGYPVAVKLSSPDVIHKSDFGGVFTDVISDNGVRKAFDQIIQNITMYKPDARINGVCIHPMVKNYDYELIIGAKKSELFGPLIIFGRGGQETEFFRDIAVGLPPLNLTLARRLIEQTKIYEQLSKGFRSKPPVNLRMLEELLTRISAMVIDLPEIKEIDINPLVVTGNLALALDQKFILDETAITLTTHEYSHLIISPYPRKYIQPYICTGGQEVVLRPVKPEDELLGRAFIEGLSTKSMRYRFFYLIKDITHEMLTRFCNIDYNREIAIVAEYTS